MLESGTLLGTRYEIEKRIGAGGMADVYRATDHKLNRKVAVKVLKQEFREDSKFVSKFRVEAQSAAGLMHPNIVNVYDVGDDLGVSYMVMELVEGITLKDYIDRRGHLSGKEVISISIQVANGIEAAHKNHIIHRDIKPQNIIISKEGKVKVTDFGIARAASSNTISSNAMGSVHYTSPEQARGGYSDAMSDVYSLGITMYEMLTGDVPFDGDSTVTIALKHLQEEMKKPSEIISDVPHALEQIVLKCCQKSPDRRYQSMTDLISDLKLALINPNGDFVQMSQRVGDETVFFDPQEVNEVRRQEQLQAAAKMSQLPDDDDDDGEDEDDYAGFVDEYHEKDENVNPKMRRVTKILLGVAIALILAMIVFFVGNAVGLFHFGSQNTVEEDAQVPVPSFLGMTMEEAQERANELGLGINQIGTEESELYDEGQICKQAIEAGTLVDAHTTIDITVSSGLTGEERTVPSVIGMTQENAEKTLTDAGFLVDPQFVQDSEVEAGKVISQSPNADTTAGKGATITIVVSTGSGTTTVPSLMNKDQAGAIAELNANGLKVGTVQEEYSSTVAAGYVISQDVAAGEKLKQGASVGFTISKGDYPLSEQVWKCNANVDLGSYDGSYPLTITLTQEGTETVIVENQVVDTPYHISVEGIPGVDSGTVTVKNASDGSVLGSTNVTFSRVE